MAFNWFILSTRLGIDCNNEVRQTTLDAVQKLEGRPLFIFKESLGIEPTTGYYFTRETGQILRSKQADFDLEARYIMNVYQYKIRYKHIATIKTLRQCGDLDVVKIK